MASSDTLLHKPCWIEQQDAFGTGEVGWPPRLTANGREASVPEDKHTSSECYRIAGRGLYSFARVALPAVVLFLGADLLTRR